MIEKDKGIVIELTSKDSPKEVAKKVGKAIDQYRNPIEGELEVVSKNLTLSFPLMNMDFTVVLNGDETMDIVDSEQRSITKLTYAGEQATIEYNAVLLEHLPENDESKLLENKKP